MRGFCLTLCALSRFILVQSLLSFLRRFRAMKLHELYLGDFVQIDRLDTFPGVMVSNGKKLSAFKQKTLGHKVGGFCRLCPGTMERLFEHNALVGANCLAHHHMGAPNSLRDQGFVVSLRNNEKLFFPVYRLQGREGLLSSSKINLRNALPLSARSSPPCLQQGFTIIGNSNTQTSIGQNVRCLFCKNGLIDKGGFLWYNGFIVTEVNSL